jgi:hypothetical protein
MSLQQLWLPYTVWQMWDTFQNILLRFSRHVTKSQADSQTVNLSKIFVLWNTFPLALLTVFSEYKIFPISVVCRQKNYAIYIKEQKRQQNEAFCKGHTIDAKQVYKERLRQKLMAMLRNRVSFPLRSSLITLPHALILLMSVILLLLTEGSTYQHLKVIQMFMTVKLKLQVFVKL